MKGVFLIGRKEKVSVILKMTAVHDYLSGRKSVIELSHQLQVSTYTIRNWIHKFQVGGEGKLHVTKQNKVYDESVIQSAVTEFKLATKEKIYLSAILDLYDRSIVSYVIGRSNNNQLVFQTLDEAIAKNKDATPLFHSDRGFQYTNKQFKKKLDQIQAT
ncbi:MAG: DDE-type integrase/transposase/recombinase [Turicibacter sp.]|nr:DDE-type integrase/transposase/recombinase [Turicibacter sp.]